MLLSKTGVTKIIADGGPAFREDFIEKFPSSIDPGINSDKLIEKRI